MIIIIYAPDAVSGSHDATQNGNTIYEGPFYETFKEQPNSRPPAASATQPQMNDAYITSNDNIYHTDPINIFSVSQGREGDNVGL